MQVIRSIQKVLEEWSSNNDLVAIRPEQVLQRFLMALASADDVRRAIVVVERQQSLGLEPLDKNKSDWTCGFPEPATSEEIERLSKCRARTDANTLRSLVLPTHTQDLFTDVFFFPRTGVFSQFTLYLEGSVSISSASFRDSAYNAIAANLAILETSLLCVAIYSNYPKRTAFHRSLLSIDTTDVNASLSGVAAAWKEASGCDWVWLWMHNTDSGQWEFLACDDDSSAASRLPPHISHLGNSGVLAYSWLKGRPTLDVDPNVWSERLDGQTFEVICKEVIGKFGCCLLDCIPCKVSIHPQLKVGICLHYTQAKTKVFHPIESLMTMGSITSTVIYDLFSKQSLKLQAELTKIASTVLASGQYRPAPAMELYCQRVLQLIQKHVRVSGVSIFYRSWNETKLNCIASTGLFEGSGIPLPKNRLNDASYNKGEGLTGGVYLTGVPYVSRIEPQAAKHLPKFTEISPAKSENTLAFALYPIHLKTESDTGIVTGIIRCIDPWPAFSPLARQSKNFDIFQLQAIECVADQVGVALEILVAFKHREKHISSIKHDLNAPLEGIRDLIARIPPPLSIRPKPRSLPSFGLELSALIIDLVVKIGRASENGETLLKRLESAKGDLLFLCQADLGKELHIEPQYSSLLQFLRILPDYIKATPAKESVKKEWRSQYFEIEKGMRTVADELLTMVLGRRQHLVHLSYHDSQNLRANAMKALGMLTGIDLQLTTPREFKPILTHLAGDIIARLCNSLTETASRINNVSIHFDIDAFKLQIPPLYVDREDVERAISNLLVNAIKYSYSGEQVKIEGRRTPDCYFIDFVNTGIEILPEEIENIFSENYRSPRAMLHTNGDGFGLKTTKEIMKRHKGDVVITHGKNPTVVSLRFPSYLAVRNP